MSYPITEYDTDEGILNPQLMISSGELPSECILCFFPTVFQMLPKEFQIINTIYLNSPLGEHPVHIVSYKNTIFSVFNPGLGGPMAGGFLEELIALGACKFILCGSAGVLKDIEVGSLIIPSFAIRDEGTSYHYLPASDSISINTEWRNKIINFLNKHRISYVEGGTWTTDAIYRETVNRKNRRVKQGCVCVDMEVASLTAISECRGVKFAPILYSGDILADEWDSRNWKDGVTSQMSLFQLCCDFLGEMSCVLE